MRNPAKDDFIDFLLQQAPRYDELILQKVVVVRRFCFYPSDSKYLPNALRLVWGHTKASARLEKAIGKDACDALYELARILIARKVHRKLWRMSPEKRREQWAIRFCRGWPVPLGLFPKVT